MKIIIDENIHWLTCCLLALAALILFGCVTTPTVPDQMTVVPVALRPTDADNAPVTATVVAALATIDAALTGQPTPILVTKTATADAAVQSADADNAALIATVLSQDAPAPTATPNLTATTQKEAAEATLTAAVPTPDLAATMTAQAHNLETAIAATLTARPTATLTPNLVATTTASAAKLETAIAATLTAQPTPTPNLAATATSEAARLETAIVATLTARSTPTPNSAATQTRQADVQKTAIAATLTARPAPQSPGGRVITDRLNIRSGPGVDYAIVGRLENGHQFDVTGKNTDGRGVIWLQIAADSSGTQQWISGDADYVEYWDIDNVPVVAGPTASGVTVTFVELNVRHRSDSDGAAEWVLTFFLNGQQVGRWPNSGHQSVQSKQQYALNRTFTTSVSPGSSLTIEVRGTELDDHNADDDLGGVRETLSYNQWRNGGNFEKRSNPVSACEPGCFILKYRVTVN